MQRNACQTALPWSDGKSGTEKKRAREGPCFYQAASMYIVLVTWVRPSTVTSPLAYEALQAR